MRLQPPDQLSTALIWLAAIMLGAKGGADQWPAAAKALPVLTLPGPLAFVPLLLLGIAAVNQIRPRAAPGAPTVAPPQLNSAPQVTPNVSERVGRLFVSPQPKAPPEAALERVFVPPSLTIAALREPFKDHFEPTAIKLLQPFFGKWMEVRGVVWSVSTIGKDHHALFLADQERDGELSVNIDAKFSFRDEWLDRLLMMKRGDPVRLVGRIRSVDYSGPSLVDCELIDDHLSGSPGNNW